MWQRHVHQVIICAVYAGKRPSACLPTVRLPPLLGQVSMRSLFLPEPQLNPTYILPLQLRS